MRKRYRRPLNPHYEMDTMKGVVMWRGRDGGWGLLSSRLCQSFIGTGSICVCEEESADGTKVLLTDVI